MCTQLHAKNVSAFIGVKLVEVIVASEYLLCEYNLKVQLKTLFVKMKSSKLKNHSAFWFLRNSGECRSTKRKVEIGYGLVKLYDYLNMHNCTFCLNSFLCIFCRLYSMETRTFFTDISECCSQTRNHNDPGLGKTSKWVAEMTKMAELLHFQ